MSLSILFSSCSTDEDGYTYRDLTGIFPFRNPNYPTENDSLRILVMGNSFSDNSLSYMDEFVSSSDIDKKRLGLYKISTTSGNINTWLEKFKTTEEFTLERVSGSIVMKQKGSLTDIVKQQWDVIVILQASDKADNWIYFYNMPYYIESLVRNCTNPNVCLVYNMPWTHTPSEMPYKIDEYIDCSKRLSSQCGINIVIPTGTAIQLARSTQLNDNMYLTNDSWHLNNGIAQFIANCVWYQKLIAPVFNKDISNITTLPIRQYPDTYIKIAKKCAYLAIESPYDYRAKVE